MQSVVSLPASARRVPVNTTGQQSPAASAAQRPFFLPWSPESYGTLHLSMGKADAPVAQTQDSRDAGRVFILFPGRGTSLHYLLSA